MATACTFVVAALSCSETNYYIDNSAAGSSSVATGGGTGGDSSPVDALGSSASSSASGVGANGGSDGGPMSAAGTGGDTASGGAGGAGGEQGGGATGSVSSSSAGGSVPEDCSGPNRFGTPCVGGLCARDAVCRPWARCKVQADDWEMTVECADKNLDSMTMHTGNTNAGDVHGCVNRGVETTYKPFSCVPGIRCTISLGDWSVMPRPITNGRCE
jgi:hypothetical protein